MTEQKQHDDATSEGMPEAPTLIKRPGPKPTSDIPPIRPASTTAAEIGVLHLHERVTKLEAAFEGFLSHEQHNHPAVTSWLQGIKNRFAEAKALIQAEMDKLSPRGTSEAQETNPPTVSGDTKGGSST